MATLINITDVSKWYGHSPVAAVSKLSLSIQSGEVYGLLGANGAGKTTTLRMIMDFIRPISGTIELFGTDIRQGGAKLYGRIGYLPGDVVLPKGPTGREFLNYLSTLSGANRDKMLRLAKRFDTQLDKKMSQLSKGNRQKIGIVQAFMHEPEILILDEPTSGLDPLMQEQFYQSIDEARARGAAILLSSHNFEEVERVCDRVGIVRKGKFVYEGSAIDVIAAQKPRWRVTFQHADDISKIKTSPALKVIEAGQSSLTVEPTGTIENALAVLSKSKIISMTTSQRGLEDQFLHFYEEDEQE